MLLDEKTPRTWLDFDTSQELFDRYPFPPDDHHASQIMQESNRATKLFVGYLAKDGKWVKFVIVNQDAYDIEGSTYQALSIG